MHKAAPQHAQSPHQPAAKQPCAAPAHSTPDGEKIAQLEAMAGSSPQAQKLAGLAAMMNVSPAMAAQRKMADMIHNGQTTQARLFEAIHNSPRQIAQRRQFDTLFDTAQRAQEEELPAQPKLAAESPAQLAPAEKRPNNTGLPDNLKRGIESLSGLSMDNVKVHYNSAQPAQLNAHAYAQGTDIHVAPGQEQHLPHEAWHVVQQAQGRVQPTMQMNVGVQVSDNTGLEHEADAMGRKALQGKWHPGDQDAPPHRLAAMKHSQRAQGDLQTGKSSTTVQRIKLPLPHPNPGNKKELLVFDTREENVRDPLLTWIASAAETNLPALDKLIAELKTIGEPDELESYLLSHADEVYKEARQKIEVAGAVYLPGDSDFSEKLAPRKTIIMRAINTGDMYQVRASMALHPDYNLLIWNVTPSARKQAEMAAGIINDGTRVYYTDCPVSPKGYSQSETWTTEDIEKNISGGLFEIANIESSPDFFKQHEFTGDAKDIKTELVRLKKENPQGFSQLQEAYRQFRIQDLSEKYAPYDGNQAELFQQDLNERGKFSLLGSKPIVIVNFRATGHSNRPGANAPALDTGLTGMKQIALAVRDKLGDDVQVVPMGEEPHDAKDQPNLLEYWTWQSVSRSRLDQTSLLRYIKNKYNVVGAIGMRSGVMDQIALVGIPIISIDISPHRGLADETLPDLATSKGWDRGLKLEDSYKQNYGHVFIKHQRKDEKTRNLPDWEGEFHSEDIDTIADSIGFYFGGKANHENYRHKSHPVQSQQLDDALSHLTVLLAKGVRAYDLIDHIRPYINQIAAHVGSKRAFDTGDAGSIFLALKEAVGHLIEKTENGAEKTIEWMRDNQKKALLSDDIENRWYKEQYFGIAEEMKMPNDAEGAVKLYKELDARYRQPVAVDELIEIVVSYRVKQAYKNIRALQLELGHE